MAMLAERKRREKWCINPRGKSWSGDQTKFGQRLLEKMGWSAGQGLGINNQGPTEIVAVRKKDDNKGFGFKDNGEEWLKTTSDFNELLDQLGSSMEVEGEGEQTNKTSSLEDRSKNSKARVHYHKFTRGKDLSRYSQKDLASIIGPVAVKPRNDDENDPDYTRNQVNKGSSEKYFSEKKKSRKDKLQECNSFENAPVHDDEDQKNGVINKKRKRKNEVYDGLNDSHAQLNFEVSSDKNGIYYDEENEDNNCIESTITVEDANPLSKKKKKRMQVEMEEGDIGQELLENYEPSIKKVSKKQKQYCEGEGAFSKENEDVLFADNILIVEGGSSKIIKKKKNKEKLPEESLSIENLEESGGNESTISSRKVTKSRQLLAESDSTPQRECSEGVVEQIKKHENTKNYETSPKKKKNKKSQVDITRVGSDNEGNLNYLENNIKRSKSKKSKGIPEYSVSEITSHNNHTEDDEEISIKQSNIKEKRRKSTFCSENDCSELPDTSEKQTKELHKLKKKHKKEKVENKLSINSETIDEVVTNDNFIGEINGCDKKKKKKKHLLNV